MPNTDKLLGAIEIKVSDEPLAAQLRAVVVAAGIVIESARLNSGAERSAEGYAHDALEEALQGEQLDQAWERLRRFRDMPWASWDWTSPSGVYRSRYTRRLEIAHRLQGKHEREPDPNCILCPSPHGRPSEHGPISSYDLHALNEVWDDVGVVKRACGSCEASPRRVHVCPECGTQCWDCSRAAHEQADQN